MDLAADIPQHLNSLLLPLTSSTPMPAQVCNNLVNYTQAKLLEDPTAPDIVEWSSMHFEGLLKFIITAIPHPRPVPPLS